MDQRTWRSGERTGPKTKVSSRAVNDAMTLVAIVKGKRVVRGEKRVQD